MEKEKERVIERFTSQLKDRLGEKILGIYLFGSVAKEKDTPESDIDLLVIYSDINEWGLLEVASKISFNLACEENQVIEIVPMSKEDFEQSLGHSPFLWEVLNFGRPIFTKLTGTEWELNFKDYLELAKEFLGYAEDALRQEKTRLAIDSGYNAIELLVKALIISTKEPLASSHGGVVAQFGKLFVLTGKLPSQFGHNLHLCLDLRASARYKPKAKLNPEDAKFVIDRVKKLLNFAEGILESK
ncbi:MAG: HEPN domain-containing protein [Candidatus Omnitrophica bacterium]|nr:HEPN domain-containing protein [Candidatus Omnitrophota bacterium]